MFKKLKALFESKTVRADPLPVYRPVRPLPPRPVQSERALPPPTRPSLDDFDIEESPTEKTSEHWENEGHPSSPDDASEHTQAAEVEAKAEPQSDDATEDEPANLELPLDLEPAPSAAAGTWSPADEQPSAPDLNEPESAIVHGDHAESESAVDPSSPSEETLIESHEAPTEEVTEPSTDLEAEAVKSEAPHVPTQEPEPELNLDPAPVTAPQPERSFLPHATEPPVAPHHSSNGSSASPGSFLPKVPQVARPAPPPVKKHNMLTPTPAGLTPEQLCGITPGMNPDQVRQRLAFLYRRYNHASSSLNAGLRAEAETALNAIVAVREKHFGPV